MASLRTARAAHTVLCFTLPAVFSRIALQTLESRSTLKAAHSAENSEQASKAIEAAKKVAAVEAKTAAKQQPGADHDCVTQAAENAVQMVEWLHDLANVPKGVVPEPVGRSLQKDMRAMLRRVLPQYQGEQTWMFESVLQASAAALCDFATLAYCGGCQTNSMTLGEVSASVWLLLKLLCWYNPKPHCHCLNCRRG